VTADPGLCAPDDPGPLIERACVLELNKRVPTATALRWCAGRKIRPYRRTDVKKAPPWQWLRQQAMYPKFTRRELALRAAAVLPALVFDAMECRASVVAFHSSDDAFRWLGEALRRLHQTVSAPPPPPRKVIAWRCRQCGVDRGVGLRGCAVCLATEVLAVRS
jgi:hypothetical protein